jgi:type IV pilus assembly protein PilM
MLAALKKRLIRKPDSIIGLDIGTGSVKLAEVQTKGARTLKSCGVIDLPENTIEDGQLLNKAVMSEALQRLIATSGTACRDVVLSVTGRALFVREITMPVMTPEELREALRWDLDKYVPYSPDSCYFDFAVLGQTEQEVSLLLVIIPKERVDELVSLVKEAGLKPVAVDIEPLALYRTLTTADNAMIIDIGAYVSQLLVFRAGSPVVTRTIPIGGIRFTEVIMRVLELEFPEAERLKQRQAGLLQRVGLADDQSTLHRQLYMLVSEIAREVRRTAEYYQIQNKGASIDKLILTGGGARLDNLSQHLTALLDTEVITHDPLAGITIPPSFDQQFTGALASQLAVAVGLSLRGGEG